MLCMYWKVSICKLWSVTCKKSYYFANLVLNKLLLLDWLCHIRYQKHLEAMPVFPDFSYDVNIHHYFEVFLDTLFSNLACVYT